MRKTIAIALALALASTSLPAFASGRGAVTHKKQPKSLTELITEYAGTIAGAPPAIVTAALTLIASPGTFNAAAATAAIEGAVGTSAFVATTVAQVQAAIDARKAAIGIGYVTATPEFWAAAKAAKGVN